MILSEIENPRMVVKAIIAECLELVQEDARSQEQRLKAMRAAVNIIELKLSKAGLLDEDSRGRIVILSRSEAKPEADTPDTPERKFRLINLPKKEGVE